MMITGHLQVAALQAEDLCILAETPDLKINTKVKGSPAIPCSNGPDSTEIAETKSCQKSFTPALEEYLKNILGFKLTVRTLAYIERRLGEVGLTEGLHEMLHKLFSEDRILEFKSIFQETLHLVPFMNEKERNIDAINALNFAIFDELQGKRIAHEGLKSVLRWRKGRSNF